jgi:hypothetical protein
MGQGEMENLSLPPRQRVQERLISGFNLSSLLISGRKKSLINACLII